MKIGQCPLASGPTARNMSVTCDAASQRIAPRISTTTRWKVGAVNATENANISAPPPWKTQHIGLLSDSPSKHQRMYGGVRLLGVRLHENGAEKNGKSRA